VAKSVSETDLAGGTTVWTPARLTLLDPKNEVTDDGFALLVTCAGWA
jgi:hypothetical protein